MAHHSRNHVVPESHLALWARNGVVTTYLRDGTCKPLHPGHVGVRSNFYVIQNEGQRDTSWERAMTAIEGQATALLRDIETRWPLEADNTATIAEYVALQVVRSPAFRRWHSDTTQQLLDQDAHDVVGLLGEEGFGILAANLLSKQGWQHTMGRLISRVGTLFGSMHFSLLRWSSPGLAMSDHPVVAVPLSVGYTGPVVGMSGGVVDLIELRLPVDPHRLLLCSWIDAADDDSPVITARREWLATVNAATIAQCEQHWIHRPGATPPHVAEVTTPLSYLIYGEEAVRGARGGARHGAAWRALREVLADEHETGFMRIVRMPPPAPEAS